MGNSIQTLPSMLTFRKLKLYGYDVLLLATYNNDNIAIIDNPSTSFFFF